jgi:hypothetical protein
MSELHIYSQDQEHGESYLMGDREALLRLRSMIDAALIDENGQAKGEFFVNDSEGYQLYIKVMPAEWMDKIQLPYADIDVIDQLTKFHPSAMFTSDFQPDGGELCTIERMD